MQAFNDGDGARRLRVRFSRPLATEVTAETLSRWLRVEPTPRDFRAALCPGWDYQTRGNVNQEVELTGAFAVKTDYRVIVEPGLPGWGFSIALRERWTDTVQFDPLPPRLTTTAVHRVGREWLPDSLTGDAAPLVAGEPGEYLLELLARDDAGREVLTAKSFDVLGRSESTWSLRDVRRVDLVPDRVEYAAGQTATILLKTPFGGRALVTVEREGVRRAFSVEVKKSTPAVTVPLEPGDAPNVFVSVLLLRGADESPRRVPEPEFRVGYCQLSVSRPESRLAVMVAAAREQFQPGEEVAAVVQVANFEGKPVVGAEITLYAVDEGIFERLHAEHGTTWFPTPPGIMECAVHPLTGKRLAADAPGAVMEKFLAEHPPAPEDPAQDYDAIGRVRLPAEYAGWLAGGEGRALAGRAVADAGAGTRFTIVSPLPGSAFGLDPDLPESSRQLPLRSRGESDPGRPTRWECATLALGPDARGPGTVATLREGRHVLRARDPASGEWRETWITVRPL